MSQRPGHSITQWFTLCYSPKESFLFPRVQNDTIIFIRHTHSYMYSLYMRTRNPGINVTCIIFRHISRSVLTALCLFFFGLVLHYFVLHYLLYNSLVHTSTMTCPHLSLTLSLWSSNAMTGGGAVVSCASAVVGINDSRLSYECLADTLPFLYDI